MQAYFIALSAPLGIIISFPGCVPSIKAMQEPAANCWPPGLFHGLFSRIMGTLFPRRSKNVTHGPLRSNTIVEVPIESSSGNAPPKPNLDANLSSEIVVEFRHTEGGLDEILMQKGSNGNRSEQKGVKTIGNQKATDSGGRQPTKKGSRKLAEERKTSEEKERATTMVNQVEEPKMRPPTGRSRPSIATMVSNINEKSEAFIRSKKEALWRNYSLDQENH